jgi:hypothetical protein
MPQCQSFGCGFNPFAVGVNISPRFLPEQEIRDWTGWEIIQENTATSIFWLPGGFNPFAAVR